MPSYAIRPPRSGPGCDIELGRGLTYSIAVPTSEDLEAVLGQLLQLPGAQVADPVGGLISNINILENMALPALYHGLAPVSEIEQGILEICEACGLEERQADALLRKRPGDLDSFDKRLAGFVRSLLSRPPLLVYSRFFEGLTRREMARAAALNTIYHGRHPGGTAVYLLLGDMPDLQPECHRRFEMNG